MDLGLKNKKALVAGASRGLGFATAAGLCAEGAQVVINARQPDGLEQARRSLAEQFPGQVTAIAGDLTDPLFPARLVEQAVGALGGLDLLFANAGGPPPASFESIDDEGWRKAIDLSFLSHVRLIRAALPALRQSAAPSVLSVTSYSVKQPIPNLVQSNSIRLATVGLIKTLALELGKEGIRFNAILPGWTETERVAHLMEARAQQNQTDPAEEARLQAAEIALGRMGKPQEFANAAVFLLSPAAAYITGTMLGVDGGAYKGTF